MIPILVSRLPFLKDWNMPLDCHIHYKSKRLFGSSKTWRGVISGVIVATLVFALQQKLSAHLGSFSTYLEAAHYTTMPLVLGALLGFGALAGDAIESFFKRQVNVAPGKSWFPFDQLDYIVGGCLAAALVVRLPLTAYVWILAIWFVLHLAYSYLGYLLHLKQTPI